MQPVAQYANDLIAILSPSTTMLVGGPPSQVVVSHGSAYAIEARAISIRADFTAGAGGLFVYLRNPGVGDVFLYSQGALAAPYEVSLPMYAPLLIGRGYQILIQHTGAAVTVAGLAIARINGYVITD